MVGVPVIEGTPVWVYGHVGVLGAVDTDDDAEETEDGGASGLSMFMTGAEGFGISATEGGLRPALPISVAPMGMPTAPTGDPGVDVPAVAAAAAAPPPPIGAQGPDGLAVVPPPATPAPMPPPPELAPMPPPSNAALLEAPVTALVTAAEVAAADNAPPHATPVKGSSGDAPDRIGLAPGVASSVAPRGIRVGPTGPAGPMPSGDVMPKGNPGEMLGACACAAPQLKSAAASAIAKRIIMASALFSPSVRARSAQPASPCNRAGRTSLCLDCRDLLDPAAAPHLGRAFQRPGADRLSGSSCACVYRLVARAQRSHWLACCPHYYLGINLVAMLSRILRDYRRFDLREPDVKPRSRLRRAHPQRRKLNTPTCPLSGQSGHDRHLGHLHPYNSFVWSPATSGPGKALSTDALS